MSNPSGEEDAIDDTMMAAPTIAEVAGTAEKDGETYTFTATVTIGQNRLLPASNPALPGLDPICDQRIVRPICLTPPLEPEPGTSFHVEVDPKGWFNNVDFSVLRRGRRLLCHPRQQQRCRRAHLLSGARVEPRCLFLHVPDALRGRR